MNAKRRLEDLERRLGHRRAPSWDEFHAASERIIRGALWKVKTILAELAKRFIETGTTPPLALGLGSTAIRFEARVPRSAAAAPASRPGLWQADGGGKSEREAVASRFQHVLDALARAQAAEEHAGP